MALTASLHFHGAEACLMPPPMQISIIDGRKFDAEGEGVDGIERCELLTNKQVRRLCTLADWWLLGCLAPLAACFGWVGWLAIWLTGGWLPGGRLS